MPLPSKGMRFESHWLDQYIRCKQYNYADLETRVMAQARQNMADQTSMRFQSFCERYLIERAGKFTVGKEQEQGWETILQAKTMFAQMESVAMGFARQQEQDIADAFIYGGQKHTGVAGPPGATVAQQVGSQTSRLPPTPKSNSWLKKS